MISNVVTFTKSIYDRKYHFVNKFNYVIKKYNLEIDSETLVNLYKTLNEINDKD